MKFRLMIAMVMCLSLVCQVRAQNADSSDSSEYLIKAGFIYNFAKLVDWPASSFAQPDSPIVIAILGTDPFGTIIDRTVGGKKIGSHPFVVKRLKGGADFRDCQILFVSSSEYAHMDEILRAARGLPILTIGETPGFANHGGIINLTLEDDKVRFEVNVDAAKQANLNISSRLLALARIVPQTAVDTARKPE
jgi:hypothetical protein